MRRAIYPGSFDPVTNGHLDVIERAAKLFDEVIVAVAVNSQKQPLFYHRRTPRPLARDHRRARRSQVQLATARRSCSWITPGNAGAGAIIRGLRAVSDFEFEFQMALMNRKLESHVETIFLMPKEEYTYLSSRIIKEIARLGGDVTSFCAKLCVRRVARKISPAADRACNRRRRHENPPAPNPRRWAASRN